MVLTSQIMFCMNFINFINFTWSALKILDINIIIALNLPIFSHISKQNVSVACLRILFNSYGLWMCLRQVSTFEKCSHSLGSYFAHLTVKNHDIEGEGSVRSFRYVSDTCYVFIQFRVLIQFRLDSKSANISSFSGS